MSASPDPNLDKVRLPAHPGRTHTVRSGRSPGGKKGNPQNSGAYVAPFRHIGDLTKERTDQGVDFAGHGRIDAIGDCVITDITIETSSTANGNGPFLIYKLTNGDHAGSYIYIAENHRPSHRAGAKLSAGDQISTMEGGIEIGFASGPKGTWNPIVPYGSPGGAADNASSSQNEGGRRFARFLRSLGQPTADDPGPGPGSSTTVGSPGAGGSGGGGGSSGGNADPAAIARAAALSTFIQLPGIFDTETSLALSGQKSLMNDQPLLPFVQQLAQASLRNFMSMPNGNFYAFFPDYFGGLDHRTPYWHIEDIEVIDGQIDLSDDALATHVYVVGDVAPSFGTIDILDKLDSSGVVTIFNAFSSDFITGLDTSTTAVQSNDGNPKRSIPAHPGRPNANPGGTVGIPAHPLHHDNSHTPSGVNMASLGDQAALGMKLLAEKEGALNFLQKYGARPHYEEAPMVRSPFFELFLAYQKFMLLWSQQFLTTFQFTFMPELFPGGIIAFPAHGIQCYVAEVIHEFDYENGFTTVATLMAPAALPNSDRQNIHQGMVRAFSLGTDDLAFNPFLDSRNQRDHKQKKHKKKK